MNKDRNSRKKLPLPLMIGLLLPFSPLCANWEDDAAALDRVLASSAGASNYSTLTTIQGFVNYLATFYPPNGNACINSSSSAIVYTSPPSPIDLCGSGGGDGGMSSGSGSGASPARSSSEVLAPPSTWN